MQTSRNPQSIIRAHEGLRGLAAIGVVLFHATTIDAMAPGLETLPFISNAWICVDLFFVLSGFVMFLRYGDGLHTAGSAKGFALRRFGRLYPLHLVTLMFFLLVWIAMQVTKWILWVHFEINVGHQPMFDPDQFNGPDLLLNLLLLHGVGLRWTDALNYPSWTVSLELWTYLIFLIVCLLVTRPLYRAGVFGLLGAASFVWFAFEAMAHDDFVEMFLAERSFMRILMSFSVGVLGALWFQHRQQQSTQKSWYVSGVGQAMALAAVALYLMFLEQAGNWLLVGPFLFGWLVLSIASDTGWLARLLRGRGCAWLGERSYSVYLVHATVLMAASAIARLMPGPAQWALLGVYLLAVLVLAQVLYARVEVPWRTYFKQLAESRSGGLSQA
ncbi:MAG: acyltransferase family protein [Burkholderiaceae bacterium]